MYNARYLAYAMHAEILTLMLCAGEVLLSSAMALQKMKG